MNLRQLGVLLGATAGILGEVRHGLVGFQRSKHVNVAGSLPALFLVGTGVVIGAIAARPEVRRRVGEWLIGKPRPTTSTETTTPAPKAVGPQPQPYANVNGV